MGLWKFQQAETEGKAIDNLMDKISPARLLTTRLSTTFLLFSTGVTDATTTTYSGTTIADFQEIPT